MKQFKGEIDGKKLTDFNHIDYKVSNLKDRLEHIDNRLEDNEFFPTYFGEYYDVSPSQSGYLAEETSVCKSLEIMGTYIIDSKDVATNRKVEYRFWTDEKEFNEYKESKNVNATSSDSNNNSVEVIDMFVDRKSGKNQKVVRPVSITKKDIKEIPEVAEIEEAIKYLKTPKAVKEIKTHAQQMLEDGVGNADERNKIKYIARNTERYVDSYVKTLRENQVLIKRAIKVPLEFKSVTKEMDAPDKLDGIDFYDENIIKKVLPMIGREEDLMSDIGIIIYDFLQFIKEVSFSPRETEVIDLFKAGYKQKELPDELGINKRTVSDTIGRIATKVAKAYVKKLYLLSQQKA